MNKKLLVIILFSLVIMGCETASKQETAKAKVPTETIIHKLAGGAPLTLPKSFEEVLSKKNLGVRFEETGNSNDELLEKLGFDFKMQHQLFFDFTSGEKMMYLIVDHAGPRFKLNEESIVRHVALVEKQMTQRYKNKKFKQEGATHELVEIEGNKFLIIKIKVIVGEQAIYYTNYTAMMKENRRNLTFTFVNYNDGIVDVKPFILAFT